MGSQSRTRLNNWACTWELLNRQSETTSSILFPSAAHPFGLGLFLDRLASVSLCAHTRGQISVHTRGLVVQVPSWLRSGITTKNLLIVRFLWSELRGKQKGKNGWGNCRCRLVQALVLTFQFVFHIADHGKVIPSQASPFQLGQF